MVTAIQEKKNIAVKQEKVQMNPDDIAAMFYVLVRQSHELNPGSKMSFPIGVFKTLPNKIELVFTKEHGRIFVAIPTKAKDRKKKSKLILPKHKIIT